MKVLKDDIAGLKAREGIQETADQRPCPVLDLSADPRVRSDHSSAVTKGHDHRKDIGHTFFRERDRQPEKGASPQIKGQTPAHAASKIYIRIPEKAAASHGSVCQYIERDLLDIIVTVIKEDSSVIYQKWKDRCHIQQRSSREQQYILKYTRTFRSQNSVLLLAGFL